MCRQLQNGWINVRNGCRRLLLVLCRNREAGGLKADLHPVPSSFPAMAGSPCSFSPPLVTVSLSPAHTLGSLQCPPAQISDRTASQTPPPPRSLGDPTTFKSEAPCPHGFVWCKFSWGRVKPICCPTSKVTPVLSLPASLLTLQLLRLFRGEEVPGEG